MKMCRGCENTMKNNPSWYQDPLVTRVKIAECEAHPVITNRRVIRTLKTVKSFSLEPANTAIRVGGIGRSGAWGGNVKINTGGGHVHERSLRLKLFDYESPFLDYLVQEGYLARHKGSRSVGGVEPTSLTVTKAGDDLIRNSHLLAEVKNDKSPLTP